MSDYITLGPTPAGEDCVQAGADDYHTRGRFEMLVYIRQLRRMFPDAEKNGVSIKIKSFPHDFGTYHEVCAVFNDENEDALHAAYSMENDLPESWDDAAKAELAAYNPVG